jgi:hypothetical protein
MQPPIFQLDQQSYQRRRQKLPPLPRILTPAINLRLATLRFPAHIPFHIRNIVELGNIAVLLHIRSFVAGHRGDEVFDDFIGHERVAEIKFGDVWLGALARGSK